MMEPELKEKWIAALRSGEYKQGKDCLRTDSNEYCCLGVLADVINPDVWRASSSYYIWDKANTLFFTNSKEEELGIHFEATALMEMNDSGKSFPEIADYIEEKL